jgi:hypothetical protein
MDDFVVIHYYKVELYEVPAMVDRNRRVHITTDNIELPCPLEKKECAIGEPHSATYIWEPPNEFDLCPFYYARTVSGIVITDKGGEREFLSRDGAMIRLEMGGRLTPPVRAAPSSLGGQRDDLQQCQR